VVGQAKRFSKEITTGVKHSMVPARQMVLEGHRQLLDEMLPRVQQVIRLAVTLNSAPHHASNRQANTLQSGTLSRS
jgi:hypothetical protein